MEYLKIFTFASSSPLNAFQNSLNQWSCSMINPTGVMIIQDNPLADANAIVASAHRLTSHPIPQPKAVKESSQPPSQLFPPTPDHPAARMSKGHPCTLIGNATRSSTAFSFSFECFAAATGRHETLQYAVRTVMLSTLF